MPRFTFKCYECEVSYSHPNSTPPICEGCNIEMKRQYLAPKIVVKGASEKNGYYIPPSNADLGMPSEYELLKEATKPTDQFIDAAERDAKVDYEAEKALHKKKVAEKAEAVKQKNPELYAKFREAQDRLKRK